MEGFDLGSIVAHIKADLSGFTSGLDEAQNQADSVGSRISGIASGIEDFATKASLVVGAQVLVVKELAGKVIDVAAGFEQTQTSFGTLLGSEQKAADLMKELIQFEQHTPFDIQTLSNATKNLLAFGVAQKEVIPHLKEFTDMSQGQADKLTELVSIYGQVNAIQQLNGREVLRLSSIGIPIYEALADHFNKMGGAAKTSSVAVDAFGETVKKVGKNNADVLANSNTKLSEQNTQLKILQEEHPKAGIATEKHDLAVQKLKDSIAKTSQTIGEHTISLKKMGGQSEVTAGQIKDMISKGEVSAKDFDAVLTEMTGKGGLFFNENIRQMSTFSGIMSSTRSQLQYAILNIMGIDIGAADEVRKGGLFDTLRTLAAELLGWLQKLQPIFKEIGSNKLFQDSIIGVVVALGSLALILPIVAIAFNPFILVILGIEVIIAALVVAWRNNFLGIQDITNTVVTNVISFWQNYLQPAVTFLVTWITQNWKNLSLMTQATWELIRGIFQMAWAIISTIVKVALDLIEGNYKRAWTDILAGIDDFFNGFTKFLIGIIDYIRGWGGLLVHNLVQPFEDAWNKISDFMGKIRGALDFTQRHSPSIIDIIEKGVGLANQAFSKLNVNVGIPGQVSNNISGSLAYAGAGAGGNIYIDMTGAVISDTTSASNIGETIGDAIIDKLKQNIRF